MRYFSHKDFWNNYRNEYDLHRIFAFMDDLQRENYHLQRKVYFNQERQGSEYYTQSELDRKVTEISHNYEERIGVYKARIEDLNNNAKDNTSEISKLNSEILDLKDLVEHMKKRLKEAGIEDKPQVDVTCRKIVKI